MTIISPDQVTLVPPVQNTLGSSVIKRASQSPEAGVFVDTGNFAA